MKNPSAGTPAHFDKAWLRFADIRPVTLNVAVLCDPASPRKKSSDKTDDAPYAEKEAAKALGARWDHRAQREPLTAAARVRFPASRRTPEAGECGCTTL
jgi:hypothetical protein